MSVCRTDLRVPYLATLIDSRRDPTVHGTWTGRWSGVGGLERSDLDGPTHRGKRAKDRSRDQLLEDGGVANMLRVTVEETVDTEALARFDRPAPRAPRRVARLT